MSDIIPKHGGYRKLKTFKISRLIFDITVRFCDKYIGTKSRTHDQMVQAARSGVQNIAEGSEASATSKKTEITLTNVARASLEELRLDYQDFLRQRKLTIWQDFHPLSHEIVESKFTTADEFATWVGKTSRKGKGEIPEIAANGVLVLINVACSLLRNQMKAQAETFKQEGGFNERLYNIRKENRKNTNNQ